MLLTNQQTNRQTNAAKNITSFCEGDNKYCIRTGVMTMMIKTSTHTFPFRYFINKSVHILSTHSPHVYL